MREREREREKREQTDEMEHREIGKWDRGTETEKNDTEIEEKIRTQKIGPKWMYGKSGSWWAFCVFNSLHSFVCKLFNHYYST